MKKFFSVLILACPMAFAASKSIGAGLFISAEGSGVTAKFNLDKASALDARISWSNHHDRWYYDKNGKPVYDGSYSHNAFKFQLDYAKQYYHVFKPSKGKLPLYFGVGAMVQTDEGYTGFGVRMPLGMSYEFPSIPLDLFVEIPLEAHFGDYYYKYDPVDLNPALGLRFWF